VYVLGFFLLYVFCMLIILGLLFVYKVLLFIFHYVGYALLHFLI
jgi:hypothetical protein